MSDSKPCKQCGEPMVRQSGHSDYGWDMKEFCDTNCRVRYSQANRQRQPRCKYCGAMLPEPTKRDGGRHGQKFCDTRGVRTRRAERGAEGGMGVAARGDLAAELWASAKVRCGLTEKETDVDQEEMIVLTGRSHLNEGQGPNQLVAIRPELVEIITEGEGDYGCSIYMRSGKSMLVMEQMPEVLELIGQRGVAGDVLAVRRELAQK